MKLALYIDEDAMDTDLVQALRVRGVDVTTPKESKAEGWTDEQQLELATAQHRALYSFNVKDYMPLHSRFLGEGKSHAGIILAEQRQYSIGEQLRRLLTLVSTKSAEEMRDQVMFLSSLH
jgi:Domain of unknown function (DUF5615)